MDRFSFARSDDAVSPVIGVMLMIVVTVVIAAVVSAFAGGFSDTQKEVPVAAFEFKVYSAYMIASSHGVVEPYLEAFMKSGEAIDTGDLKIVSYHEAVEIVSQNYASARGQGEHYSPLPRFQRRYDIFFGDTGSPAFGRQVYRWC